MCYESLLNMRFLGYLLGIFWIDVLNHQPGLPSIEFFLF